MTNAKLTWISFRALTKAAMKMYYRNRGAIVFSLAIPLALMAIFGFLSRGAPVSIKLGVTNHSSQPAAQQFVDALENLGTFKVTAMAESEAAEKLGKGEIDLQVIIPEEFGALQDSQLIPGKIVTRYNSAKPQSGQIANLAAVQIISDLEHKLTRSPAILSVESEGVTTNNLTYFDFILPGIIAMTIMQVGIFGVAFSFVAMKASGALRRIQATPVKPIIFVLAQAVVRLTILLAITAILVGCGTYFFHFHMQGSYWQFALVAIMGILIFLGFGLSIAGRARDEAQVGPIANLIQLPLLLLSGVFFSRDGFPAWLKTITDYSPLTYLSHSLRTIANEGAGFAEVSGDVVGMIVWLILTYLVAARVFRWE